MDSQIIIIKYSKIKILKNIKTIKKKKVGKLKKKKKRIYYCKYNFMFIVAVFSNFERQHIFWNSKMKHPWTIQKLKGRSFLRYKVFYFWFWWLCPILTFPLLFIAFSFSVWNHPGSSLGIRSTAPPAAR